MSFIITPATPVAVQAIASGTIPGGATVIIKSDGTIAAVASSGSPQNIGSSTTIVAGTVAIQTRACYDAANQAVVVFFADNTNSNFLTAIVGTVSGTAITFGTKVVVKSLGAVGFALDCAYDSVNQKVLFVYQGTLGFGQAKVGTVSGTSISFGGEANFDSFTATLTSCEYDTASGKLLVAWKSSNTNASLAAATISGTSVSFGTTITATGNPAIQATALAYEPISGKLIYVYNTSAVIAASVCSISGTTVTQNTAATFAATNTGTSIDICNAGSGTVACVFMNQVTPATLTRAATISGTTITWGGSNTTIASTSVQTVSCSFDTTNNKIAYAYDNAFRAATVSGTTITLETAQAFSPSSYGSIVFMPNVNRFTFAGRDNTNTLGVTYKVDTLSTNLTANNFVGFSSDTYASGAQATVKFTGSVITGLTGLTAATKYYVQYNGTLATTADAIVGAVYAGIAVSSTSLIMN